MIRCGTAPASNYAEARAAESRRDFIHKMRIALKELRETLVWLELLQRLKVGDPDDTCAALRESEELIAIFVTSLRTAGSRPGRSPDR